MKMNENDDVLDRMIFDSRRSTQGFNTTSFDYGTEVHNYLFEAALSVLPPVHVISETLVKTGKLQETLRSA
jgi:hypothetical protein